MVTEPDWDALERAWAPARVSGALGPATIAQLREHAAGFVPAACRVPPEVRAIDVGSGVGVPGLLLALLLPRSRWTLIDAQAQRCALAEAAARAIQVDERVDVRHGRVDELARHVDGREVAGLVVARLFGPAAELAECAVPLLAPGGALHVSVSEETLAEWQALPLDMLGARFDDEWSTAAGRFARVVKESPTDGRYPRRAAARRRLPFSARFT